MEDKEVFLRLTLIKDALDKNDLFVAKSLVNEQVKKIGMKLCEQKLISQMPKVFDN